MVSKDTFTLWDCGVMSLSAQSSSRMSTIKQATLSSTLSSFKLLSWKLFSPETSSLMITNLPSEGFPFLRQTLTPLSIWWTDSTTLLSLTTSLTCSKETSTTTSFRRESSSLLHERWVRVSETMMVSVAEMTAALPSSLPPQPTRSTCSVHQRWKW